MRAPLLSLSAALVMVLTPFLGGVVADEAEGAEPATASTAPEPSDDCKAIYSDIEGRHAELNVQQEKQRDEFNAGQQARKQAFESAEPQPNEAQWAEFDEKEKEAREAFERQLWLDREAKAKAWYDEANARCGPDSQPGDGSAPRDHPRECEGKAESFGQLMEKDIRGRWEPRFYAFMADFDQARKSGQDADWSAYKTKLEVLLAEMREDIQRSVDQIGAGDCYAALGGFENLVAPHLPVLNGNGGPAAARPGGHPMPAGGVDSEMEAKAKRIWEQECQPRIQALVEEYHKERASSSYPTRSPYPTRTYTADDSNAKTASSPDGFRTNYESYPTTSGSSTTGTQDGATGEPAHDLPAELRAKVEAIQKECMERVRALFEDHVKEYDSREDGFHSLKMFFDEENNQIVVKGACISMVGLPDAQMMTSITVGGVKVIDRLFANGYLNFQPENSDEGTAIMVWDNDHHRILAVHDNCRGVINLATSDLVDSITLDLADDLKLERASEGIRWSGEGAHGAVLVHGGSLEIAEGNVITLAGKATFLVANEEAADKATDKHGEKIGDRLTQARLEKRIGAEVTIAASGESDPVPYGDMEVQIEKPENGKFSARIESAEGTGKTVVFRVDSEILNCQALRIAVAAVAADGTESGLELREATSLEDVLDPLDDGEATEWWVVSDKNGCQIMVSFPHFSEKKVTIESADLAGAGSYVPGFEGILALVAIGGALVAAGVRRRSA